MAQGTGGFYGLQFFLHTHMKEVALMEKYTFGEKKRKCDGFRQVLLKGFLRDGLCAPYELASSVRAAAVLCSFFCHSSHSLNRKPKKERIWNWIQMMRRLERKTVNS